MSVELNTVESHNLFPIDLDHLDTQRVDDELAGYGKALSHPVRIKILRILTGGSCTCGGMVEQLPLAQSTVSQHLKVLRQAGLILGEDVGSSVYYSIDPSAMRHLRALIVTL